MPFLFYQLYHLIQHCCVTHLYCTPVGNCLFKSTPTAERIATQPCFTGVAVAGIQLPLSLTQFLNLFVEMPRYQNQGTLFYRLLNPTQLMIFTFISTHRLCLRNKLSAIFTIIICPTVYFRYFTIPVTVAGVNRCGPF